VAKAAPVLQSEQAEAVLRNIGADVNLRERGVAAQYVDDVVHRDHRERPLPRCLQTVNEAPGEIREERVVQKQIIHLVIVLRQGVAPDDLDILKTETPPRRDQRTMSQRQNLDSSKAAPRDAGAVEHDMTISRSDITEELVWLRSDDTENLAQIPEWRFPERKVLVAEAVQ